MWHSKHSASKDQNAIFFGMLDILAKMSLEAIQLIPSF